MTPSAARASTGGSTLRIGLTGPIGCGKSTVAGWLGELGATVIDADEVARVVVEPGEPALAEVFAAFGRGVRAKDGSLDRQALGRLVFDDPVELARLEHLLHPAIRARILETMAGAEAAGAAAVVIEAIKLVEGGLAEMCDEVWLVTCPGDAQRARLEARGLGSSDAAARIGAQATLVEAARATADRVIETGGSIDATRDVVRVALRTAMATRPTR